MARSGDFSTSNNYIVYWIEAIQNSQNVTNNTSNVTVRVWVKRTNTGYTTYGSGTVYCTINGSTYTASLTSSHKITSSPLKIFEKTVNIGHNSDGTKTLGMSARIQHNQFSSNTHSWSMGLTTIPRASTISSLPNFNIGSSFTVSISRANSSFTHMLMMYVGSTFIGQWENIGTSATITLNSTHIERLYGTIPNSTSATVTMRCYTYQSGKQIGSWTSRTCTAYVPSNVRPSLSHIYHEDTNTTVKNTIGSYVQGLSKIKITIPASGITLAYGSPIKSYKIYWESSSHNGTVGTFDVKNSGSHTIRAEIVDGRGRVGTYTTTVNVSAYQPPKISGFSVERVNSDGSPNSTGTYVAVRRHGAWSTLGGKNNVTIRVFSKPRSSSSWSEVHSATGTTGTFGGTLVLKGYEVVKSYDFRVEVADLFNTTLSLYNLSTGQVTMSWGPEGIGIGKVWESGTLDVSGAVNINSRGNMFIHQPANLTSGTDLNDIKDPGYYFSRSNVNTQGIVNSPTDLAFMMEVLNYSGDSVIQRVFPYTSSSVMFVRSWMSWNNAWSPWRKVTDTAVGSNSNGSYIRFADGVQICYRRWEVMGNGSKDYIARVTLPIEFANDQIAVNVTAYNNYNGAGVNGTARAYGTSINNYQVNVGIHFPSSSGIPNTNIIRISMICIGRY